MIISSEFQDLIYNELVNWNSGVLSTYRIILDPIFMAHFNKRHIVTLIIYASVQVFTQVVLILSIYPTTILTCCAVVLCPVPQKKLLKASSDCSKTVNRCWIEIKLKQSKPCHTDRFVALTKGGLRNCTSYVRLKRWKYLLFKCTFTYPYQPNQASLVAHSDDDLSRTQLILFSGWWNLTARPWLRQRSSKISVGKLNS